MNTRVDYPDRGALGPDIAVVTETSVIEPAPESAVSWGAILAGAVAAAALSLVLLILGVPDVVIDSIMGWEPGGAARMRARYMHVTGTMLRKVAKQVGDALWELPTTN